METEERLRLLADVAELYYIRGLKQSEIANLRGFSRSAVSRLLTEAHERNIIEIKINHPLQRSYDLEYKIMNRFNLEAAYVVTRGILDYQTMLRQLGKIGAGYIEDNLPENGILGVSWGTAGYEVANAMKSRNREGCTVVQMLGALGRISPHIDGNELVRSIAQTLGAHYQIMHAPLFVDSLKVRDALLNEPHIRETIALALQADIALAGIGSIKPEVSTLMRSGYVSADELSRVTAEGAVGDICSNHINIYGDVLDIDINRRAISVDVKELKKTNCKVLGVAGGKRKARPILGALRGGFVNILVTDSAAIEEVLRLDKEKANGTIRVGNL